MITERLANHGEAAPAGHRRALRPHSFSRLPSHKLVMEQLRQHGRKQARGVVMMLLLSILERVMEHERALDSLKSWDF